MIQALALAALSFALHAAKAVVVRYKTEVIAGSVMLLAVSLASGLDRWLVIAAIFAGWFIGSKDRSPAVPTASLSSDGKPMVS